MSKEQKCTSEASSSDVGEFETEMLCSFVFLQCNVGSDEWVECAIVMQSATYHPLPQPESRPLQIWRGKNMNMIISISIFFPSILLFFSFFRKVH